MIPQHWILVFFMFYSSTCSSYPMVIKQLYRSNNLKTLNVNMLYRNTCIDRFLLVVYSFFICSIKVTWPCICPLLFHLDANNVKVIVCSLSVVLGKLLVFERMMVLLKNVVTLYFVVITVNRMFLQLFIIWKRSHELFSEGSVRLMFDSGCSYKVGRIRKRFQYSSSILIY